MCTGSIIYNNNCNIPQESRIVHFDFYVDFNCGFNSLSCKIISRNWGLLLRHYMSQLWVNNLEWLFLILNFLTITWDGYSKMLSVYKFSLFSEVIRYWTRSWGNPEYPELECQTHHISSNCSSFLSGWDKLLYR